jgi:hypothetical protein
LAGSETIIPKQSYLDRHGEEEENLKKSGEGSEDENAEKDYGNRRGRSRFDQGRKKM